MVKLKKNISVLELLDVQGEKIIDMMKAFIASGGKIDELFGEKGQQFTMLQACCGLLKEKAVIWLLEKGANPNLETSNLTPLSMVINNYYLISQKNDNYWNKFSACISALEKHGVDFNRPFPHGDKPIFSLLDKEKEKIPQDIIQLFFDKSDFAGKSEKKNFDILKSLLSNHNNFTFQNVSYLIEKRGVDLNNKEDPANSLVFTLSSMTEKEIKPIKKAVEKIHEKYGFDFGIKCNSRSNKKIVVKPIENAITKKNFSIFKMIVASYPAVLSEKFGDLNLAQYCGMTNFTEGLKYIVSNPSFNWENKEDLVTLCSTDNTKVLVKKEHMRHMYDSLDSQLSVKTEQKPVKRMKI